jgi:hypothetical protein
LDPDVAERMRDLIRCDLDAIVSVVERRFASQRVRWAEDPDDKHAPCVKNFVLEETEAFPFEMPELKARLKQHKEPGRTIVYAFPGVPTDVD